MQKASRAPLARPGLRTSRLRSSSHFKVPAPPQSAGLGGLSYLIFHRPSRASGNPLVACSGNEEAEDPLLAIPEEEELGPAARSTLKVRMLHPARAAPPAFANAPNVCCR